jgi:hypothetical protein
VVQPPRQLVSTWSISCFVRTTDLPLVDQGYASHRGIRGGSIQTKPSYSRTWRSRNLRRHHGHLRVRVLYGWTGKSRKKVRHTVFEPPGSFSPIHMLTYPSTAADRSQRTQARGRLGTNPPSAPHPSRTGQGRLPKEHGCFGEGEGNHEGRAQLGGETVSRRFQYKGSNS